MLICSTAVSLWWWENGFLIVCVLVVVNEEEQFNVVIFQNPSSQLYMEDIPPFKTPQSNSIS